ncbi:3256_t:CDS:1, partial [Funneliformis mosseae]
DSNNDIEKEETQIQNQLDQWLKILQENNENIVDLDFDIM